MLPNNVPSPVDRNYTNTEISRIVEDSLEVQTNLFPYYCKENMDCWWIIKRCIVAVKKYDITPELYWHGDSSEYAELLSLLSGGYPSPDELLNMAKSRTIGDIKNIAAHFYQYISVMFEYVKTHHGYVVLRPSAYMQTLYPNSKDMLYVYTTNKWSHSETSNIGGAVLTFRADEMESFPKLLKNKLGIL